MSESRSGRLVAASAFALFAEVILASLTGTVLASFYHATTELAYKSVEAAQSSGFLRILDSFHYWLSGWLILHGLLHIIAMLVSGTYEWSIRQWYAGLVTFASTYLLQLTGNFLPFDRHGVQTAVVEGGLSSSIPIVGPTIRSLILNGNVLGEATLQRWWLLHAWILPIAALLGAAAGIKKPRIGGRMWRWTDAVPSFIGLLTLAIFMKAPLGMPATPADFGEFGATVSWYTWPLHGTMVAFQSINPVWGWVGMAVVPGLMAVWLMALPFFSRKLTYILVRLPVVLGGLVIGILSVIYGGPVAPLTGNRDPVQKATVAANATPHTAVSAAVLAKGKDLFNSVGCSGCHGIDGKAGGNGPSLAKSDKKQADPSWYEKFIHNPKSVDPQSTMPAFPSLTADQLSSIGAYLANPH